MFSSDADKDSLHRRRTGLLAGSQGWTALFQNANPRDSLQDGTSVHRGTFTNSERHSRDSKAPKMLGMAQRCWPIQVQAETVETRQRVNVARATGLARDAPSPPPERFIGMVPIVRCARPGIQIDLPSVGVHCRSGHLAEQIWTVSEETFGWLQGFPQGLSIRRDRYLSREEMEEIFSSPGARMPNSREWYRAQSVLSRRRAERARGNQEGKQKLIAEVTAATALDAILATVYVDKLRGIESRCARSRSVTRLSRSNRITGRFIAQTITRIWLQCDANAHSRRRRRKPKRKERAK